METNDFVRVSISVTNVELEQDDKTNRFLGWGYITLKTADDFIRAQKYPPLIIDTI
jgi:hypothetical protein